MTPPKTKVLFIAGSGRCGSTLFNSILGQIAGVAAVGETRYLWDRGLIENHPCGCGVDTHHCPAWSPILAQLGDIDPVEAVRLRESFPSRYTLFAHFPAVARRLQAGSADYAALYQRLYQTMVAQWDCHTIVDASKFPSHGFILNQLPNIDLYVLHLVRDARAVAYSWQRKKQYAVSADNQPIYIPQHSPLKSSYWWGTWNLATELMWGDSPRYLRLTYEAFAANPRAELERVLAWSQLGVSADSFFTPQGELQLTHPVHAVSGNPSRFQQGPIRLKLDREWQAKMTRFDYWFVTALTWPWLWRYRYLFG